MNAGFEDCAVFDSMMDAHMKDGKVNWEPLFKQYQVSDKRFSMIYNRMHVNQIPMLLRIWLLRISMK